MQRERETFGDSLIRKSIVIRISTVQLLKMTDQNNFSLTKLALGALIDKENHTNPDIDNDRMNASHMLQCTDLKLWKTGTFDSLLKEAMTTAKSMIYDEKAVLQLRFIGVLARLPLHPQCPCHKHTKTLNLTEKIPTGPGKLANVFIRIHSAYPYNVTEITLRIFNAVLGSEQVMDLVNQLLMQQQYEAEVQFLDGKYIQWFKRPHASFGYEINFLED